MFSTNEIHSLTDFQRNTKAYVQRLADTKRPEVLTVNGEAQLVIQDARAYEEMLNLLHSLKQINASLGDIEHERVKPVGEARKDSLKRLSTKYPDANI
jgi:PHD/YefM family antitoxin component YafN of YafNO toxin-antitoxin module